MADQPPAFTFDPISNRYRHAASGRYVPEATVRGAVDQVLDAASRTMRGLTDALMSGQIGLTEWRGSMEAQIKSSQLAAGLAARGGLAQASQADLGWIGQRIRSQYEFLDNFAADLVSGRQLLNGTVQARAELYGQAGRATHREMERRIGRLEGDDEESNELGIADSCDECLDATAQGWVPIGSLPAVGDRLCGTRCRCTIVTRSAAEAAQDEAA
jgi:hypothetical protein